MIPEANRFTLGIAIVHFRVNHVWSQDMDGFVKVSRSSCNFQSTTPRHVLVEQLDVVFPSCTYLAIRVLLVPPWLVARLMSLEVADHRRAHRHMWLRLVRVQSLSNCFKDAVALTRVGHRNHAVRNSTLRSSTGVADATFPFLLRHVLIFFLILIELSSSNCLVLLFNASAQRGLCPDFLLERRVRVETPVNRLGSVLHSSVIGTKRNTGGAL